VTRKKPNTEKTVGNRIAVDWQKWNRMARYEAFILFLCRFNLRHRWVRIEDGGLLSCMYCAKLKFPSSECATIAADQSSGG